MVNGQIGWLAIAQCYASKRKPDIVIILHHLVEEKTAVDHQ